MGKGANRNKYCRCGSGKKIKNCGCKLAVLDMYFPNGRTIDLGNGYKIHMLGAYSSDEYNELDNEERKYAPFYNVEQIHRILKPSNAADILLKKQADSIVNNMRVFRVFYDKYNRTENWNYDQVIDSSVFKLFNIMNLDEHLESEIQNIPCGLTYDSDPNGCCIKTEYGNIITISAVLQRFLYYMNLFYLGCRDKRIPGDVTVNALVLAIRIMLKAEALDFELDPRGEVPQTIDDELSSYTLSEMFFVIAHEYSHSLLKHLDSRNIIEDEDNYVYYNQSQRQEFEADKNAIHILKNSMSVEDAVESAVSFFLAIDLYEQAKEQISPDMGHVKTHPKAVERIRELLKQYPDVDIDTERLIAINQDTKAHLMELISTEYELFENYGSVYLGQWHKKRKIDRVDY